MIRLFPTARSWLASNHPETRQPSSVRSRSKGPRSKRADSPDTRHESKAYAMTVRSVAIETIREKAILELRLVDIARDDAGTDAPRDRRAGRERRPRIHEECRRKDGVSHEAIRARGDNDVMFHECRLRAPAMPEAAAAVDGSSHPGERRQCARGGRPSVLTAGP